MQPKFFPPVHERKSFHCPHCGVFAAQQWEYHYDSIHHQPFGSKLGTAICKHCNDNSVWVDGRMVYPASGTAPLPNPDMPEDVTRDYMEAREIVAVSARGAAALLRLAIQRLCPHLGEKGKNINEDIKNLVAKGLPAGVQQALDAVRVIGNESVHPGQIDLDDQPETAQALFRLVNIIVEKMITDPKEIQAVYDSLPVDKLKGIENRDK